MTMTMTMTMTITKTKTKTKPFIVQPGPFHQKQAGLVSLLLSIRFLPSSYNPISSNQVLLIEKSPPAIVGELRIILDHSGHEPINGHIEYKYV